MREILFRGKRTDNGEWVEGYYVAYRVTGGGDLYHHIKNANDTFPIIPETVGQFTGLTDKNGTKIFEGDVDKSFGETILWYPEKGCYALFKEGRVQSYPIDWNRIEVTGNIHDK